MNASCMNMNVIPFLPVKNFLYLLVSIIEIDLMYIDLLQGGGICLSVIPRASVKQSFKIISTK